MAVAVHWSWALYVVGGAVVWWLAPRLTLPKGTKTPRRRDRFGRGYAMILVSLAAGLGVLLRASVERILSHSGPTPFAAAVIGVVVAAVLFRLRDRRKDAYGFVEVLVGIATVAYAGSRTPDGATAVTYLGGVYVLIRGFTNIQDDWRARADRRERAGKTGDAI